MKMKPKARNICIGIAVVLLILCGLLWWNHSASSNKETGEVSSYREIWYNETASFMGKGVEESDKTIVQEYTVVISRSFFGNEYLNVKIFPDKTGKMIRRLYDSEEEGKGKMVYDKILSLTQKQTSEIVKLIEENDFWNLPAEEPMEAIGLDGHTVFIEGKNKKKHNFASMWCPKEESEIYKIYHGLFDYADMLGLEYNEQFYWEE